MESSWRGMLYSLMMMVFVLMILVGNGEAQLVENFYAFSCPSVEFIVRQAVLIKLTQTFTTAPATLRLFFHDCFVEGCDASVMIASRNNDAEKDAADNQSLAGDGFDTVIQAKQAVEAQCPGVVSCADVLAIAARDVVALIGGPAYNVELGRRDGLLSKASRVAGNLPEPDSGLEGLNSLFSKHNLSLVDMIALSGAHTIGFSHCNRFTKRLYSFTSSSSSSTGVDPSLDPEFAKQLISACPKNVDPAAVVDLDLKTPQAFDNLYYQNLLAGQGLLTSDQVLFTHPSSKDVVINFASNSNNFNTVFATAMVKLGRTGVKTGTDGEIRRDCTSFNT